MQRKAREMVIAGVVVALLPLAGLTVRGAQGLPTIMVTVMGIMMAFVGVAMLSLQGSDSNRTNGPIPGPGQSERRIPREVDPRMVKLLSESQARQKKVVFAVFVIAILVLWGLLNLLS